DCVLRHRHASGRILLPKRLEVSDLPLARDQDDRPWEASLGHLCLDRLAHPLQAVCRVSLSDAVGGESSRELETWADTIKNERRRHRGASSELAGREAMDSARS